MQKSSFSSVNGRHLGGALALALTAGGCTFHTGLTPPPGTQATEPGDAPEQSTGALANRSDARLAQLDKELSRITYLTVTEDQLQIDRYHPHVFTPRGSAYAPPPPCDANPSPTWITKWGPCEQMGTQALAALVQARVNETYAADLSVAIAKERAAWEAFDANIADRLAEAAALGSLYERAPALFALFQAAREEMNLKKLPRAANDEPGAIADIAEAIFKAYDGAGAAFAFDRSLPTETGRLVQKLDLTSVRAWGEGPAEEKHFAALSMKGQAPAFIRDLPLAQTSPSASPVTWVRWPFDLAPDAAAPAPAGAGAIAKKIEEAAKKTRALEYPSGVVEDAKTESTAAILGTSSGSKLVWVAGRVTRLESKDGAFTVELARDAWKADTKCIPYGPITGINPKTGKLTRNEKCNNTNERKTARRFRVTLADWPKSVDLGDMVAVFGDLQAVAAKGTKANMSVDVTIAGRFVGCSTAMPPVDAKAADQLLGLSVPMGCKNPW